MTIFERVCRSLDLCVDFSEILMVLYVKSSIEKGPQTRAIALLSGFKAKKSASRIEQIERRILAYRTNSFPPSQPRASQSHRGAIPYTQPFSCSDHK
jgi:hypothetical protein